MNVYSYLNIEPRSTALQADSLPVEPQGKPKNTGVGSLSFLQWIFLTQESNQGSCIAGELFTNWAIRKGNFYSIHFSSSCFCPVWPLSSHSRRPRCPSSTVHLLSLLSLSCLILQSWIQVSSCFLCANSCLTLCDPMDYSSLGSSVL